MQQGLLVAHAAAQLFLHIRNGLDFIEEPVVDLCDRMDGFERNPVVNRRGDGVNALIINMVQLLDERFIAHLQKSGHHQALAVLFERMHRL